MMRKRLTAAPKARAYFIPWLAVGAILSGCVPKNYEWSPDGQWMTVIGHDGLSFADADGKPAPGMIKDVKSATWFGDSKRLLVCRQIDVATWDALTHYLTPEQSSAIADAAGLVHDAALKFDWQNADPKNAWGDLVKSIALHTGNTKRDYGVLDSPLDLAVGLYLRDHADAALQQKVPPRYWLDLVQLTQPIKSVEVYGFDPAGPKLAVTLMQTAWDVRELRVSPNGNAAIIVTQGQMADSWKREEQADDLWIAPTDGGHAAIKIASLTARYPDWSIDGRDILFVRTPVEPGKQATLGTLSRVQVIGDDGSIVISPKPPEDLVGLLYSELSRARCLKDGRILFASAPVTLPATTGDMPSRPLIFSLNPDTGSTVSCLITKQAAQEVGDAAQYFEVSPDDARVSIPDGSGRVMVLELANGEVTTVQDQPVIMDNNNKGSLTTIPVWRSPDELTFAAPGDQKGSTKIMLWSISKNSGKVLSAGWPAGMTQNQSPTSQP